MVLVFIKYMIKFASCYDPYSLVSSKFEFLPDSDKSESLLLFLDFTLTRKRRTNFVK